MFKLPVLTKSNPKRDLEHLFIIGAPVLSFYAVTMVSNPRSVTGNFLYDPETPNWFIAFSAILTHTHVMMVFYRSHLNENIFKRYPIRFIVLPIIALLIFTFWGQVIGVMAVVAFYWDEWHTILQTFGFGRIYDARKGNDPNLGRKLDIGISFVLCLFPHLIMLTFLPENQRTAGLEDVLLLDKDIAIRYGSYIHSMKYPLIITGVSYIIFYLWSYWKLVQNGYKISGSKIALLGSTCITAVLIALFYSIADAAHYFNIYHSIQYVFIVYMSELPLLKNRFRMSWIFCATVTLTVALAAGVARDTHYFPFLGGFWILSSLLHFWYDGFIWSVRKSDVA